ncbi:MAG: flagellar M-ring protein FliF [Sphingopyxis sp.]|nr:flagellar M-ring protein FliF [Sphingopyxis sp.]
MADAPTGTAIATLPTASPLAMGGNLREFMARPAVARALPALGVLALLGTIAIIWSVVAAPAQRSLYAGANEADKAAISEVLSGASIPFAVDSASGAITVAEEDVHRARMLIAGQGLPRAADSGEDPLSAIPMGASRAVEGERIRGAREDDLARTIENIDIVEEARIHIAASEPSPFVRNTGAPAASVMLRLAPGRSLSDAQTQAIIHLVASSVPDMAPERVALVDQNGRLLSRGNDAASAATERQIAVQDAIEDRYRQSVVALLTPILGAGNFTAEVHAELDFSEVQSTREGFPPSTPPVLRSEEGQTSTDTSAAAAPAAGVPGAIANQPPPPATTTTTPPAPATAAGAAAQTNERRSENYARNFAVNREVSVTRQQSPTVRRVSVAVALRNPPGGQPRPAAEVRSLETLVQSAVGFNAERGDVVTVAARPFAATTAEPESILDAPWLWPAARHLTAIIIAALVIFGIARPLMKRSGGLFGRKDAAATAAATEATAATPAPSGQARLASEIAGAAALDPDAKVSIELIEATQDYEVRAALIRNFVRQDPARAALVVRDLIRDGGEAQGGRNG